MPVFIGYDQAERMVAALLDHAARWCPDAVAGIARGGLVPASMAAGLLALPLAMLACDRHAGTATWIGPPPDGRRILLVDDCCATGRTMGVARAALHDQGFEVLSLTVVHDPDTTAYVPDLSHPMRELFRFPWERGEATPAARALRATGEAADRRTEAPFIGLGLDGIALRKAAVPLFTPGRAVVITGRPETDRERVAKRVACWLHAAVPLECRPAGLPGDRFTLARYKAEAATRWGCTHFIETDPEQAIRIAALAPHLIVSWWSSAEARGWLLGAVGQPASPVGYG
ncbi:MAG TPA: phosphoribosyltransferase [Acetobacteraceae bacterium]|nr:phosphoribosyltransferase [Acetobacteraceae bacterium]